MWSEKDIERLRQEASAQKNALEGGYFAAQLYLALDEIERLRLRRFTVEVLGAETAIKPSKYTVECHGRDDAMLIAFALDGGWTRGDGSDTDASGMLPLAQEYCAILHEEAAEAGKGEWITLVDKPPPENVEVLCLTRRHGTMNGVRRGDTILVGVPDSWGAEVTHWKAPATAEAPEAKP